MKKKKKKKIKKTAEKTIGVKKKRPLEQNPMVDRGGGKSPPRATKNLCKETAENLINLAGKSIISYGKGGNSSKRGWWYDN